eukprot:2648639-Alexandrium_andersonii.AAC.1
MIALAQQVWRRHFGEARQSPALPRVDAGSHRAKRPHSEAEFLRRRRVSVGAASSSHQAALPQPSVDITPPPDTFHTDAHVHAETFQDAKLEKRRIEAYKDGHLMPDEIDPDLEQSAHAHFQQQHKRDMERVREAAR